MKIEKRVKAAKKKQEEAWENKIRAHALTENGYTVAEIAETLGVSKAAVRNYLREEDAE